MVTVEIYPQFFKFPVFCRIVTDMDAPKGAHLMGPQEEGSLNIVTLLLTGRATPYLHNGVIYVGDEDHYALPQFGILARAPIGLFVLGSEAEIAVMVRQQLLMKRLLKNVNTIFPLTALLQAARLPSKDANPSHLGHQLRQSLWRSLQLESRTSTQLSRRKALRTALLHLCRMLPGHDRRQSNSGRCDLRQLGRNVWYGWNV